MKPDISVIVPYHDGRSWLPRALKSVLSQKEVSSEIIVVDDGSALSPAAPLLEGFAGKVRLRAIAHSGKGAAINAGTALAGAEFLCILDQDDLMLEDRLVRQLAVLRADVQLDGVYSDYERRDEQGRLIDVFLSRQADRTEHLRACALGRGLVSMQTLMLRKSSFDRLGGFSADPKLSGLDDAEFFARLLASDAQLRYVPGISSSWTSHPGNYSKSAAFQDVRLALLERLSVLAADHPAIRQVFPLFARHARSMRGLYCLEHGMPADAVKEFKASLGHGWSLDACYLLLKSHLQALVKDA